MRKTFLSIVILGSLIGAINASEADTLQASVDNLSDKFAADVANRWQFKGDFRFRNESIDQEFTTAIRNRDRIRLRVGVEAVVNPTVKAVVQFSTTENGDARSTNQTLGDVNSHKALDLDLAYIEWTPNSLSKVTLGKMKYPWTTTTSYFFDKDINTEGAAVALNHVKTGTYVNVFVADLVERSALVDSRMIGYQVGMKNKLSDDVSFNTAVAYFNHRELKGQSVVQSGSAGGFFGNTTKTSGCLSGATVCLVNDYNVVEAFAELNGKVGPLPVTLLVDFAKNRSASSYNKALAYGVTLNKASLPGSWEIGYLNQETQKDAIFAQWHDSDFGSGSTESKGHVVRGAYQIAKNWKVNATYFLNKTNINVPVVVTYPKTKSVLDRDYKRLQLDLNYTF